jgi:hypothetical protein
MTQADPHKRTEPASEVLEAWNTIHDNIFTREVLISFALVLKIFPHHDRFVELRESCTEDLVAFINDLTSSPYEEWGRRTFEVNPTLLVFLRDRWDFVSAYLDDLGEAEVTHDTHPGPFVKEALLDWWDQRDQSVYL